MRKFLILSLFATAAVACGGDDSISFADLPDSFVDAQCKNAVACETIPDDATCHEAVDLDPGEIETIQNGIDAGTIVFDSGAAAACVDEIAGQGCDFPGFHSGADPCADMFQGTVATGGACDVDIECAGNATCDPTDVNCDPDTACCPGTCGASTVVAVNVAIGGTCNDTSECVTTAYCKTAAGAQTGTCTAVFTADAGACDADSFDSCANPMICDFLLASPVCETPAASNATCDAMDLIPCIDSRDHCDATGKCVPNVDVGGACPVGDECIGFSTCINGSCVANPGAGDACVVDTGADCLGALSCTGGTCQFPPASMVCN